ncbi:MAG: phosphate signaling complex protein PhoU [bacterium]|nr:phosphate signaling complex protein PhoU [bacterium]
MAVAFEQEIDELKRRLLSEGAMVEDSIAKAIVSLIKKDERLAESVMKNSEDVSRAELQIEEECLRILTLHNPVAKDLRLVIAALKINEDLERMGDLARKIAKRTLVTIHHPAYALPIDLERMAKHAQTMVKHCLDAFVNHDAGAARQVVVEDGELDEMRRTYTKSIIDEIRRTPAHTDTLLEISSIVRHLERLGDMSKNVAREVVYLVEGEIIRDQDDD